MARFYSAPAPATKKAAGSQPQFLMALELYVDQPKVLISQNLIILLKNHLLNNSLCSEDRTQTKLLLDSLLPISASCLESEVRL
jgi:hypothetical protein